MALTLASCYLTQTDCSEVERYCGGYDFTTTSTPTLAQVEEYVYDVAGLISLHTKRAGQRYDPPVSGITDTYLARIITQANAVGAAFKVARHWYVLNGDDRSKRLWESLAADWESYMGKGAADGGALSTGIGGQIQQAVESVSASRLLVSPVSQGEVTLEDLADDTQAIVFTRKDVD